MEHLTSFQRDIVKECESRRRGGISVPMGSGKTLLALAMASCHKSALVIVSKTLIESWKFEIQKFFGDSLKYAVFHSNVKGFQTFIPSADTVLVITTPEVAAKAYKQNGINRHMITTELEDRGGPFPVLINRYHVPTRPFEPVTSQFGNWLFSTSWDCMFIDEIQSYTNVSSTRCLAMASIYAKNKWGLSGTLFTEPKPERILGYHLIIGDGTFPNSIPDASKYLKQSNFPGLKSTLVVRTMTDYTLPNVNEQIIEHELTADERKIYKALKSVMNSIQASVLAYQTARDTAMTRKFNAMLLAMITYARQFLVCPLIPYACIAIDLLNIQKKNQLAMEFNREMANLNLENYLSDPDSSKSSRIQCIIDVINSHKDEKIVVFTCFRTNLNVMQAYIPEDRSHFVLASNHTSMRRAEILSDFEKSSNGILLLTYDLGAEGLNLQHCSTVLLADMWWNCGKTQQAIARVLRRGQLSTVNVYFFTSNTGIEKGLFTKHVDKLKVLKELESGPARSKVKPLTTREIIDLINLEDNANLLRTSLHQ